MLKTLKDILYYPLWTFGNIPFSFASFIKFFLILSLLTYMVRWSKKRALSILSKRPDFSSSALNSVITLGYYFAIFLVWMISLSAIGINLQQITVLLGALGVGIGFGLQAIANNFVSGLILLTERAIKIGDIVELENSLGGEVRKINMRATVVRTYDGMDVVIPNSQFISNRFTTWTYEDDWRRIKIPFGVSYGSDPFKVQEVAYSVAREIESTEEDETHKTKVLFVGFGESSLDFMLFVWCRMARLRRSLPEIVSDYYFALYEKFREANIEIPFPQNDIHIKSVGKDIIEALRYVRDLNRMVDGGS